MQIQNNTNAAISAFKQNSNVMVDQSMTTDKVEEKSLEETMNSSAVKRISGAAIDVFEQEPYSGKLATLDRCLLTSHMGSMSIDCRSRMEIEATEEAVQIFERATTVRVGSARGIRCSKTRLVI